MNLDTILYAILFTIIIFLVYHVFSLNIKIRKISAELVQKYIDLQVTEERIDELVQLNLLTTNPNKEFIKFLSESRESSYLYIEEVQNAILNLEESMASGKEEEIQKCYEELLKFLPEKD